MFGSVVLNIIIGLVFIYLLYSLLTTIIVEIITTIFGLRARNLNVAIERLLMDDDNKDQTNYKFLEYFKNIGSSLKKLFNNKQKGLLKEFYDRPSIKYLSKNKFFKSPSYISPQIFSKTIIDIIKDKGGKGAAFEKVKSVLEKAVKDSKVTKDISADAEKIESDPTKLEIGDDTLTHISSLLEDANYDMNRFKANLEAWYDETSERSIGWYKRNLRVITLIIGFSIAILFNVNTFDIVDKLAIDRDAREQLVQMAISAEKWENTLPDLTPTDTNTDFEQDIEKVKARIDALKSVQDFLQKDIDKANELLGMGWGREFDQLRKGKDKKEPNYLVYQFDSTTKTYLLDRGNLNFLQVKDDYELKLESSNKGKLIYSVHPESHFFAEAGSKIGVIFMGVFGRGWGTFFGYFLTALAISLGAPFWFDILNKLIKLRSSVQQTVQKSSSNTDDTDHVPPSNIKG